MQEYRSLVLKMIEIEQEIYNQITDEVFEWFELDQRVFQESYSKAALPENEKKFCALTQKLVQ